MIRHFIQLLVCLFFSSHALVAQRQIVWSKTFSDPNEQNDWYGRMIRELPDGDLIVVGDGFFPATGQDIIIKRLNPDGDELWSYILEKPHQQRINWGMNNCVHIIGNDIYILGITRDPVRGQDPLILKMDVSGLTPPVEIKDPASEYGGVYNDWARNMRPCANGDFVICGATNNQFPNCPVPVFNDVHFLRISSTGQILHQKNLEFGQSYDDCYAFVEMPNGDFLIAGDRSTYAYYARLSATGELLAGPFFTPHQGMFYNIEPISGGNGYMLCGRTRGASLEAVIWKLDADLNFVWEKKIDLPGGQDNAYSLRESPETPGKWYCTGETQYNNNSSSMEGFNYWVFQFTDPGLTAPDQLDWQEIYGGTQHEWATSLELTNDGGIVMNGLSWSADGDVGGTAPHGYGRFWVLKIKECEDADGDGYTGCNGDCDDSNAAINPGAEEECQNGLDDNCDGLVDQQHPTVSITNIIDLFNAGKNAIPPTIVGNGNGNLNNFTNALNHALDAATPPGVNFNQVMQKLNQCFDKSDGIGQDWIKGSGVSALNDLIELALDNFACSGIPIPFAPGGGGISQIEKSQAADRISPDADAVLLFQNQPNPFSTETTLGFYLPYAMEATISVFDIMGKRLFEKTATFAGGETMMTLPEGALGATGVLTYRLDTPLGSVVRKMVRQ